jgi:hypothetical protein
MDRTRVVINVGSARHVRLGPVTTLLAAILLVALGAALITLFVLFGSVVLIVALVVALVLALGRAALRLLQR